MTRTPSSGQAASGSKDFSRTLIPGTASVEQRTYLTAPRNRSKPKGIQRGPSATHPATTEAGLSSRRDLGINDAAGDGGVRGKQDSDAFVFVHRIRCRGDGDGPVGGVALAASQQRQRAAYSDNQRWQPSYRAADGRVARGPDQGRSPQQIGSLVDRASGIAERLIRDCGSRGMSCVLPRPIGEPPTPRRRGKGGRAAESGWLVPRRGRAQSRQAAFCG